MKRIIKMLGFVLALISLLAFPVLAEDQTPRASSYFVATRTYLDQTDTSKFDIWFEVTAKRTMLELGVESIVVKRSADGNNWTTMRTCVPSVYPQMIRTNTAFHCNCVSYNATAGYYYKAYVTYYAKDSNGIGTYSTWTDILYLPSN